VTRGNIAGLLATAFVALFVGFAFESCSRMLWNRKIGYGGELWRDGESVSQSPLKDKAFSTFLNQNPPFELPEKGDFAFDESPSRPAAAIDNFHRWLKS
jgi:hypothetical protein